MNIKWKKNSLKYRLMLCLFLILFLFSLLNCFSYLSLQKKLIKEVEISTNEQIANAISKLDEKLSMIYSGYCSLITSDTYSLMKFDNPSDYDLIQFYNKASQCLRTDEYVKSFMILIHDCDTVVSSSGNYSVSNYFAHFKNSEIYSGQYWKNLGEERFSIKYLPAAVFSQGITVNAKKELLLPLVYNFFWSNDAMVVMFLDISSLCRELDTYLAEDFYIYNKDGQLLYASGAQSGTPPLPASDGAFLRASNDSYIAQRESADGQLTYIKAIPQSVVIGEITKTLYLHLVLLVVSFAFAITMVIRLLQVTLNPLQNVVRLFAQETTGHISAKSELTYIETNVKQILAQQREYVKQLSSMNTALSGLMFRAQLKNIYIDLNLPTRQSVDTKYLVLFIQIHYLPIAKEQIEEDLPVVTHTFLQYLQQTLTILFKSSVIFQLEQKQFIAKVEVTDSQEASDKKVQELLKRLENEKNFAFFTIVQSPVITEDGDFASAYEQILTTVQFAKLESTTQLLQSPISTNIQHTFSFPQEKEWELRELIRSGRADAAAGLVERILSDNIESGICRIDMILLGSSIASITVQTLTDRYIQSFQNRSIINFLMHSDTPEDYVERISGFVRSNIMRSFTTEKPRDKILDGIQRFIEKNYQREFLLDEIAGELKLTKSYLSTYYKKQTNINLSDSIQYFRIQKAMVLLKNTDHRITDVGAMVGIGNFSTFLRQFKKYTGMSPKEFRREMNNASEEADG